MYKINALKGVWFLRTHFRMSYGLHIYINRNLSFILTLVYTLTCTNDNNKERKWRIHMGKFFREREASDTHGQAKAMMEKTITVLNKQETVVLYNLNWYHWTNNIKDSKDNVNFQLINSLLLRKCWKIKHTEIMGKGQVINSWECIRNIFAQ